MSTYNVHKVSYDDDSNRQVDKDQIKEPGQRNRRVALVIDFAGA